MGAYEQVQAARLPQRPDALQYIRAMVSDFVELYGDRRFADDAALVAGLGYLNDTCVTVLALEKGEDNLDRLRRNFGSAQPEGYRKALWHLRQAEKFRRPVLCFVDTSGAYCGIGAEERGQGQAIARNLMEMMWLKTPVLSILIGEGGSGGALGLAVADEVWMLENAVYSVISPEGCASILWKDAARAPEAAECLRITAPDLLRLGVIERIIREEEGMFASLSEQIAGFFSHRKLLPGEALASARYGRFRKMGEASL